MKKLFGKSIFMVLLIATAICGIFMPETDAVYTPAILLSIPTVQGRAIFTNAVVAYMNEQIPVKGFLRSFFQRTTSSTRDISIEVKRGTEKVAADVIRGTHGNYNKSTRSTQRIIKPPYYREYITISDLQYYDVAAGQQDPALIARVVEEAGEQMVELRNKIERAYEKQAADIFKTGVITLNNGTNINYNRKANSMVNVSVSGSGYWTTGAVDPINDLITGCNFLRREGKMAGGTVNGLFGGAALNALLNNSTFQSKSDLKDIKLSEIYLPNEMPEGAILHGVVSAGSYMVRVWSYPEVYDDASGTSTPYLNENEVILLPSMTNFKLSFAGVPRLLKETGITKTVRGEYTYGEYLDDRGAKHDMDIQSAGVAVPVAVDQIYTMQVTA